MQGVLPCNAADSGAVRNSWTAYDGDELLEPPLEARDLAEAVRSATPTVSSKEIELHRQFSITGMQ